MDCGVNKNCFNTVLNYNMPTIKRTRIAEPKNNQRTRFALIKGHH